MYFIYVYIYIIVWYIIHISYYTFFCAQIVNCWCSLDFSRLRNPGVYQISGRFIPVPGSGEGLKIGEKSDNPHPSNSILVAHFSGLQTPKTIKILKRIWAVPSRNQKKHKNIKRMIKIMKKSFSIEQNPHVEGTWPVPFARTLDFPLPVLPTRPTCGISGKLTWLSKITLFHRSVIYWWWRFR